MRHEIPLEKLDHYGIEVFHMTGSETTWETDNCNTNIAQNLKNLRQSDNEIWSVNRI